MPEPQDTTGGKTVDSPTTDGADQAKSATDQILDAVSTETTDQLGQGDTVDPQATDDSGKVDDGDSTLPDKDTLPFDQHPKWQSARAAEKAVQEILDKHGYDDMGDLVAATDELTSIKQLLGDRDAETLVAEFEEFQRVKQYWADQEAAKREADETPEETAERFRRENQELRDRMKQEQDDRESVKQAQQVLQEFDNTVRTAVDGIEGSDLEKAMLTEFLGLESDIAAVDPMDKRAVKSALTTGIQRFNKFLADIKQQAVDDYAASKSDITPIGPSDTATQTDSVATEREPLPKDATMDQVNAAAKDELLERISKAVS